MKFKRLKLHVEFVMTEDFYDAAILGGETPDTMLDQMKKEFDGDPNIVIDVATVDVADDLPVAGVV